MAPSFELVIHLDFYIILAFTFFVQSLCTLEMIKFVLDFKQLYFDLQN